MGNPQRSIFGNEDERSETTEKILTILVVKDIPFTACIIRS